MMDGARGALRMLTLRGKKAPLRCYDTEQAALLTALCWGSSEPKKSKRRTSIRPTTAISG